MRYLKRAWTATLEVLAMLDSGKLKLMYLRLSKEDDDIDGKGQESFSIGSQRLLIQQYVESHSELGKYSDFE